MKLSVCIFTYNHEAFIAQAIESAINQNTNFDYEIVIGEDCSTDTTRSIIEQYQEKYPKKIRAQFNSVNLGMMKNNSQTINLCAGKYIALMDGDDYWTNPNKLQIQHDFLENNSEYSFCFHDAGVLGINGKMWQTTCCGHITKTTISFSDIIYKVSIPTLTIAFRKSALKDYPPIWFNSLNAPDRPLFLLLSSQGPGFYFNESWGVYRKHPKGAWTGQHYQSQCLTLIQIYRIMNKSFNNIFKTEFTKYESKIYYELSLKLLKDYKLKRSVCCFRRHRQIGVSNPGNISSLSKIINFHSIYLFSQIKHTIFPKTTSK